jgi:type II protein arginine methyltransferase
VAAPLYLGIVQQVPDLLPELEAELAESLGTYANEFLYQDGAMPKALWLLDNATRSLPSSKLLAYEQGCLCFRARQYLSALDAFRRALRIDPGYFAALDALENMKNLILDRWHFRMLNDKERNVTYRQALRHVLAEETIRLGRAPRVMDIGTGTGLLAWFALEAGAGEVVACETNPVLCAVASDLLPTKGGRVQIQNKSSYDVQLVMPVDVVVTELVDSGLLGEHILPVLRHARQQMLPGGRVIPHAATVHAMVIESTEIRRRSRVLERDGAATLWWGGRDVTVDESYTCEDLAALRHRRLTQPVAAMEIPLSHPPPRAEDASESSLCVETDLEIIADGQADAVAMWFDLDLLPPDAGASTCAFSTGPGREGNGWDQGIYFLPAGHVLRRGQRCRLRVAVVQDQLTFKLVGGETMDTTMHSPPSVPVKVGEMDMAHLNDTRHIDAYRQALTQTATAALVQGQQPITAVVEWSGNYSVLGLVAASVPAFQSVPLMIVTGTEESAITLRTWCQQGLGTPLRSVHVISSTDDRASSTLLDFLTQALSLPPDQNAAGAPSCQHVLVIHELVESSGWLRQGALQEARLLQSVLKASTTTTTTTTVVLPAAISVFVQGLEAPALLRQNRLEPENLLGFPAEQLLDGLGVRKFRELDLGNTQDNRPVTAAAMAFRVDMQHLVRAGQGDGANAEEEGEIVARAQVELPVTEPGTTLHAVGFWFLLHLTPPRADGNIENDDKMSFNTGEEGTSYGQGAVLVGPAPVVAGQRVQLEVVWSVSRGIDLVVLGAV